MKRGILAYTLIAGLLCGSALAGNTNSFWNVSTSNLVVKAINLNGSNITSWAGLGSGAGTDSNTVNSLIAAGTALNASNWLGWASASNWLHTVFYPLGSNPSNYLTAIDWTANPSNSVLQGSINGKQPISSVLSNLATLTVAPSALRGDGQRLTNVATTAGSVTGTCATASFSVADIGKAFVLFQDATNTTQTTGTITATPAADTVVLSTPALASGAFTFVYGTDNTAPLQALVNQTWTNGGGRILFGSGMYLLAGGVDLHPGGDVHGIISLPSTSVQSNVPRRTIEFVGVSRPAHGYTLEVPPPSTNGTVLFCPTRTVQTNRHNAVFFSSATLYALESYVFRDMALRGVLNPSVSMLDFRSGGSLTVERVTFDHEVPSSFYNVGHSPMIFPSTNYPDQYQAAAILAPVFGNNADVHIRDTDIYYYPVAVRAGEHTSYVDGNIFWCSLAFDLSQAKGHGPGLIANLQLQDCPVDFGALGAAGASAPIRCFFQNIRMEHYTNYVASVVDTNYSLAGLLIAESTPTSIAAFPTTTYLGLLDLNTSTLNYNKFQTGGSITLNSSGLSLPNSGSISFAGRVDPALIQGYDATYRIGVTNNYWRIVAGQGLLVQSSGSATASPILRLTNSGGTNIFEVSNSGQITGDGSGLTGTGTTFTAGSALSYTGTNYFAYVNSSNYVWTTYADTLLSNLWLITVINGVNVNTNTLPNR